MRRLSTLTLSLLTLILGVTAWAQVARNAEKAPRAAGDIQLVSATPASGSTVAELSGIRLNWSTEIGLVNEDSYDVGTVLNEAGEVVAKANADMAPMGDYTSCMINSKTETGAAIDAPGTYTVVIDANMFGEDFGYGANRNVTNDRIELKYTILGEVGGGDETGTRPKWVKTTPSTPVAELSTIEVTFDQPVELSMTAQMTPVGIFGELDMWNAAATAYPSMKEGDDTTVVFTLDKTLTEADTYNFPIEEGFVYPKGSTSEDLTNEMVTIFVTVSNSGTGGGDEGDYAKFELSSNSPKSDYSGPYFTTLNFDVTSGSTIDPNVSLYLVDENGSEFALEVIDMIKTAGVIVVNCDNVTISGVYTLTVPAGFVTDKNGNKNKEWTNTWTYTNPNGGSDDDDRKLEILAATVVNDETGESINLMDENSLVPSFGDGWTLHITPNIYDAISEMHLAVSHYGIDEVGMEGTVYDKRIEMRASNGCKENGEFTTKLAGASKLYEGTVYTLVFDAEDTSIAPELRKDWGTVETTVMGGNKPFKYSPAELVSVWPEVDSEIFNPNQEFRLTFSQPVNVTVEFNLGQGASSKVSDVVCNEDRTVWTFTLGASLIESETASLGVIVYAKDLDGLVVKGNNATEDKSCYALSWDCHLGCPGVTITPAAGTLDKIFSFTAVAEDGNEIQLGNALDKPYLTTASGAVVAEVNMESEKKYLKDGQLITPDMEMSDAGSVKVTFELDKEITAPGKYILVCPFAAFGLGTQMSSSSSRPMQIEYLIEGTPEFDHVSIAEGASVSELSYVVVYINEAVTLDENARMQLRSEEGVLANANLITAVNNGVTMLIADFMIDGKPYQLESGVEYALQIAKESIFLAGTDMAYPALRVNIVGASGASDAVALTQEIAGLATTVNEVVKGTSATVALAPAEGWKVGNVTFNGTDVTAAVKDNTYTTPALTADSKLDVTFEYDGELFTPSTSTELITEFKLRAYSENGEIVVANLQPGMVVNVFTIDGAAAGSYNVKDMDVLNVKVVPGIYVVTVTLEGKTQAIKLTNK